MKFRNPDFGEDEVSAVPQEFFLGEVGIHGGRAEPQSTRRAALAPHHDDLAVDRLEPAPLGVAVRFGAGQGHHLHEGAWACVGESPLGEGLLQAAASELRARAGAGKEESPVDFEHAGRRGGFVIDEQQVRAFVQGANILTPLEGCVNSAG